MISICVLISLNLLFLNILAYYFDSTGEPLKADIYIYIMHLRQAPLPTAYATWQPNSDFTSPCQFYVSLKLNYLLCLPEIGLKAVKIQLNTMSWIKAREHHSSHGAPDLCNTTWNQRTPDKMLKYV